MIIHIHALGPFSSNDAQPSKMGQREDHQKQWKVSIRMPQQSEEASDHDSHNRFSKRWRCVVSCLSECSKAKRWLLSLPRSHIQWGSHCASHKSNLLGCTSCTRGWPPASPNFYLCCNNNLMVNLLRKPGLCLDCMRVVSQSLLWGVVSQSLLWGKLEAAWISQGFISFTWLVVLV